MHHAPYNLLANSTTTQVLMHNAAEWGRVSEEERKQVTERHEANEQECKGSAGNFNLA